MAEASPFYKWYGSWFALCRYYNGVTLRLGNGTVKLIIIRTFGTDHATNSELLALPSLLDY